MLELKEASINIELAYLRKFLERVAPFLPGFGPLEITQVVELAMHLPVDEEHEFEFAIEYAGQPSILKVGIFIDDIDEVSLYLFAPHEIAEILQTEMGQYADEYE